MLEAIRVFGASNINSVSVIWLHSERTGNELSQSNSDNAAIFERFQEYFSDLVYLREQLLVDLGIPKLWFFINRVGIVETPFSQRFASILNDLGYWQIELARVNDLFLPLSILPRTFSVTQGTLSDDALHYSSIGYNNLGAENATNWDLFMEGNDISNLIYGDNDLYLPSIVVEQPF